MLALKLGVRLKALRPQLVVAMVIAEGIWRDLAGVECVVTSCNDGKHCGPDLKKHTGPCRDGGLSKHYTGRAVDIRTKNIPEDRRVVCVNRLQAFLGDAGYRVMWEGRGTINEHVHIEYDPPGDDDE